LTCRGEYIHPRRQVSSLFAQPYQSRSARTSSSHHWRLGEKAVTFSHFRQTNKDVGNTNPKTDVIVEVIWVVPVAVRTAGVPLIIVERAAAQNTIPLDAPFTTGCSSRK